MSYPRRRSPVWTPTFDLDDGTRVCARCGERQPVANFYWVRKSLGTRRGQCKACMAILKMMQKDPDWLPECPNCGERVPRMGPGRRLCAKCFDDRYDRAAKRDNGSHLLRIRPCSACGVKRLREDHIKNTSLCAVCRSVPQQRRKRLKAAFNMTPREYVELLEAQRYMCPICGRKPSGSWNIDHQHKDPMIVRGATCGPCNTLIGLARDNVAVLTGAATYLLNPPAQAVFPGRIAHPEANRKDEGWRPLTRRAA